MKKMLLYTALFFCACAGKAGDTIDAHWHKKYISFDMNPMLAQVIPLNRIGTISPGLGVMSRNYWGQDGIRFGLGLDVSEDADLSKFAIMLGYDRRRELNDNWMFFKGMDLGIAVLTTNDNQTGGGTESAVFFFGPHWGIEYRLSRVISFTTEVALRAELDVAGGDASAIRLRPPVNFFVHFNLNRDRIK